MNIKRDLEFLYELGCFRFINRVWVQLGNPNFQNNAEHTFRVIWLALILAKYEKSNDVNKIIKMALVHDLPESRTGDVHYISRLYTSRDEESAIKDIFNNTSVKEFIALWQEYEKRKSLEAKIVKDADSLDVDLELQEQANKGIQLQSVFAELRAAVAAHYYTKSARKLWKEIQKSNPHDWHLHARNRYTAGDWSKFKKK